jgi:hypothetical protein
MTLKEALLARVKTVYISPPIDPMQEHYGVAVELTHPADPGKRWVLRSTYSLEDLISVNGDQEVLRKKKAEEVIDGLVETYALLSMLAEPQAEQRIDEALQFMGSMALAFETYNNDWTLNQLDKIKRILRGQRT